MSHRTCLGLVAALVATLFGLYGGCGGVDYGAGGATSCGTLTTDYYGNYDFSQYNHCDSDDDCTRSAFTDDTDACADGGLTVILHHTNEQLTVDALIAGCNKIKACAPPALSSGSSVSCSNNVCVLLSTN